MTKLAPKKLLLGFLFLDVLLVCLGFLLFVAIQKSTAPDVPQAMIGNKQIALEIADSSAERAKGLSGRENLADGQGVLFVFERSGSHCMWMKDMKFAIDMLWLDESHTIVKIERAVSPGTYPARFCNEGNAKYVLELNANQAAGTNIGEKLQLEDL